MTSVDSCGLDDTLNSHVCVRYDL